MLNIDLSLNVLTLLFVVLVAGLIGFCFRSRQIKKKQWKIAELRKEIVTNHAYILELQKEYVTASRVAGAGTLRLMFSQVLPNCTAPLIVQATLGFSSAILDAAALGFLGLGVQPPSAEWGAMLASARDYIDSAWWIVTMPGLSILISVLAINLLGDGLRDALDPKLKRMA